MTEPLSQEEGQILYDHMEQMQREYQAWHNLMEQFHMRGVDKINEGGEDEPMYRALILWSEELAELRRVDPNKQHKFIALDAAREGGSFMSYEYVDANGDDIKIGDRVKMLGLIVIGVENPEMSHGVVTKIDEPDGDVDDEGRAIGIDPEVHIKFDDGDEDHFNGRWTGTFYTDDAPFQFEDIEKIKEGS